MLAIFKLIENIGVQKGVLCEQGGCRSKWRDVYSSMFTLQAGTSRDRFSSDRFHVCRLCYGWCIWLIRTDCVLGIHKTIAVLTFWAAHDDLDIARGIYR